MTMDKETLEWLEFGSNPTQENKILAGVIDSSYRGEWKVILHNTSTLHFDWDIGDRIAQAIPEKISTDQFEFVESLSETDRGSGGFGSSGR